MLCRPAWIVRRRVGDRSMLRRPMSGMTWQTNATDGAGVKPMPRSSCDPQGVAGRAWGRARSAAVPDPVGATAEAHPMRVARGFPLVRSPYLGDRPSALLIHRGYQECPGQSWDLRIRL